MRVLFLIGYRVSQYQDQATGKWTGRPCPCAESKKIKSICADCGSSRHLLQQTRGGRPACICLSKYHVGIVSHRVKCDETCNHRRQTRAPSVLSKPGFFFGDSDFRSLPLLLTSGVVPLSLPVSLAKRFPSCCFFVR